MRLALVLFLSGAAAFAQTKQARGKQLIDDLVAALGGRSFLTMENRVESGRAYSFYHEQLSGLSVATIYTRYLSPDQVHGENQLLVREREAFGKDEKSGAVLFTGAQGYQISYRGARPLPEDQLARYRATTLHNIFYILRERLNEPGLIFEYQGTETVDNMPVNRIDITDSENVVVTVWIHQSTHLPVRQLYYRRDPLTNYRIEEVTLYGKYHDIGAGITWPLDIQRLRNGDRIFQMYSESAAANQKLSDNLFVLPSDMKVLKPIK
jgi:hypothetical protein